MYGHACRIMLSAVILNYSTYFIGFKCAYSSNCNNSHPTTDKVKVEDIEAYAPKDLLIVTTGSQVSLPTCL